MNDKQRLQTIGLKLDYATARIHWIITDFRYGHLPQDERVLSRLETLRDTVNEAITEVKQR